MVDTMVGYGPSPDFGPRVPDFLVVQDDAGRLRVVSRDGDISVPPAQLSEKITHCSPEPIRAGCWPLVFSAADHPLGDIVPRVEWFPLSEEARWRPEKARQVLAAVHSVSHPELVLRTVKAASALVSLDIEKVARELAAEARPGESLMDVYDRRKR